MIKQLPGWLNYILLWAFYLLVGLALDAAGGWHTDRRFIGYFAAFFAGGYLAKWRFYDKDGWRFW